MLFHPCQHHVGFGGGEGRAPVSEIVLHERHRSVHDSFLDFVEVHLVDSFSFLHCLNHRRDVKGFVAVFHVFFDEGFGDGIVRIEREVRVGGVAEDATAVLHDLSHLLVSRQIGVGSLIHGAVGHCQGGDHNDSRDDDFAGKFHGE